MNDYYTKYIKYLLTVIIAFAGTAAIVGRITYGGIVGLITKGMVGLIVTNLIYIMIYGRTKEFRELCKYVMQLKTQLKKGK